MNTLRIDPGLLDELGAATSRWLHRVHDAAGRTTRTECAQLMRTMDLRLRLWVAGADLSPDDMDVLQEILWGLAQLEQSVTGEQP
jgi:hypothetical protein